MVWCACGVVPISNHSFSHAVLHIFGLVRAHCAPLPAQLKHIYHCCACCAGACPKSYGTNVARLAGLPASVVTRAGVMSASREAMYAAGAAQQQQLQQDRLQQPPAAGTAAGGGDAMDVDVCQGPSGGDGELQQLVGSVRKCLLKLKAGDGADEGQQQVQEQLAQLQQRATLLCA